jgi:hypothetical protein
MHMPIERTVPSELKLHFCHDAPPQSQICSGEPSLALRALTLMHRPEAKLEIERVELTAALPAEPPDEPWPEDALPWDCLADAPDFPAGVPPLPGLAPFDGEADGLPVTGGDTEGAAPGQFGAGAPGFRAPGARSAAGEEWWSDRPGEDTSRSGTAISTAAAAAMRTTLARERRVRTGATTDPIAAGATDAAEATGTTARGDGAGSGENSSAAGTAVTLGSTTQLRITGPAACAVSVIGVLLPPPAAGRGPREPPARSYTVPNHTAAAQPTADSTPWAWHLSAFCQMSTRF